MTTARAARREAPGRESTWPTTIYAMPPGGYDSLLLDAPQEVAPTERRDTIRDAKCRLLRLLDEARRDTSVSPAA
jgi:hypothetical protein